MESIKIKNAILISGSKPEEEPGVYIGRRADDDLKERIYLTFKPGDANHILILGESGYGKTTLLRALAESIFDYYRSQGQKVIIILFERKMDITKINKLREFYESVEEYYGEEYAKSQYPFLSHYLQLVENDENLGMIGDFSMGWPNYMLESVYLSKKKQYKLSSWHDIEPDYYPTTRFVFRPTRVLEAVQIDNGYKTIAKEAKINLKNVDFETIARRAHLTPGTRYGRIFMKYWDIEKIRDPDKLYQQFLYDYKDSFKYDDTMNATKLSIQTAVELLKLDSLFISGNQKDFVHEITADRINIIDFSTNSDLNSAEEALIFEHTVKHVTRYALRKKIPVFIIIDEVHELLEHRRGREAIDDIYRMGRSLQITLISATQYLYSLPSMLYIGAQHIFVVGNFASRKDKKILEDFIGEKIRVRNPEKGKGILFLGKRKKISAYFRPSKTL